MFYYQKSLLLKYRPLSLSVAETLLTLELTARPTAAMASVYRSLIASRSRACLLGLDSAEIPSVRRLVSRMRLAKSSPPPSPSSSSPSLHFRLPLFNRDCALPFPPDDQVQFHRPFHIKSDWNYSYRVTRQGDC